MLTFIHLTTVHPRRDTRIFVKEVQTLAESLKIRVVLMVADGIGISDVKKGQIHIHDMGSIAGGRLLRILEGNRRSFSAIRKLKPAVVHFHDPELIPVALLLKLAGCTVVYDVHEDVPRQTLSKYYLPVVIRKPIAWVLNVLESNGAKAFDAVVAATPKIAARFPAGKTITVQNFPIAAELMTNEPIPYAERPPAFAYVGAISATRGAEEMVRAFGHLADRPDVRLHLAGPFSPAKLKDTLAGLPGWTSVKYEGSVSREELARLLSSVRAGLVTLHPTLSYLDSYPVKMFEYMSVGLPVIASDFPLWRQIVSDAGCGLLVVPSDPKAIADAMRWILDHPAEAEEMGRRGRKAVEKKYCWDAEARKLTSLYKILLSK